MLEVTEETLVQEVMVKVKEEMVEELMGATWDRTEMVRENSRVYNHKLTESEISESIETFNDFCDHQNDPESENEDGFENDTHISSGNLIDPILPPNNTHCRRKLFSPRHFQENNEFTSSQKPLLYCDVHTKNQNNTVKKAKHLKPSNLCIFTTYFYIYSRLL